MNKFKVGDRVRMLADDRPIPTGTLGTITLVDGDGLPEVKWDTGRVWRTSEGAMEQAGDVPLTYTAALIDAVTKYREAAQAAAEARDAVTRTAAAFQAAKHELLALAGTP